MVAQPVAIDPIATLARRIASPRTVKPATLARRERSAYRLCQQLQGTLALLDSQGAGWGEVYRVLLRAYEAHSAADRRLQAALDEAQARRWEEEQAGAALQADRVDFLWESSIAD